MFDLTKQLAKRRRVFPDLSNDDHNCQSPITEALPGNWNLVLHFSLGVELDAILLEAKGMAHL